MNERIKELMIESGSTGTYQVWFTRNEVHKLAELLIQECTIALENNKANVYIDSYIDAILVINEHFGLE